MTVSPVPSPNAAAYTSRVEEDDHDLLTYNESGARLAEAMREVEAELGSASHERAAVLVRRLALLSEAARRNTRWAANDVHAAGFMSYRGPGTSLQG